MFRYTLLVLALIGGLTTPGMATAKPALQNMHPMCTRVQTGIDEINRRFGRGERITLDEARAKKYAAIMAEDAPNASLAVMIRVRARLQNSMILFVHDKSVVTVVFVKDECLIGYIFDVPETVHNEIMRKVSP